MAIVSAAGDIEARYDYWIELGRRAERERIAKELEQLLAGHTKIIHLRPDRKDTDNRHAICRTYQQALEVVKGENV